MHDARAAIVHWYQWLETERARCTYTEGPQRMESVLRRGVVPFVGDCSATVRAMYAWANAPDPMGLGYGVPEGYTGTELSHGEHIALLRKNGVGATINEVRPGDVVVYGPGTGWHTAIAVHVDGLGNVLTLSMGQQGDPSYVWANGPNSPHDGRQPQTWLRFGTMTRKVITPQSFFRVPAHTPLAAIRAVVERR
jgi:hypothetical protein